MKPLIRYLLGVTAFAVFVGCEWETPDSENTWTENGYSWVNLTGMYRPGVGSSVIVNDPSSSSSVTIGTNDTGTVTTTNTVTEEPIANGDGSSTVLEGILEHENIAAGTFSVAGGGWAFVDNGDGTLSGTAGATGTIEYETGRWALDFMGVAPADGAQFIARYQWLSSTSARPGEVSGQGNSGSPIYTMFVEQTGNKLVIQDGNGDVYEGILVSVQSTAGLGSSGTSGQVIAQYQVTGLNKKANVTIEGAFLANYTTRSSMTLNEQIVRERLGQDVTASTIAIVRDRTMTGTWLEHAASGNVLRTGDVVAFSDELQQISLPSENINTNLLNYY